MVIRRKTSSISMAKHGSVSNRLKENMEKMREARKRRAEATDVSSVADESVARQCGVRENNDLQLSDSAKNIGKVAQSEAETSDGLVDQSFW